MGAEGAKGPSGHWSTNSEPEPLNPLIHRYPLGRGIPSSLPNAASPHPSFWKGSSDLSDVLSERLSEVPAPPVEGSKAMELRWPPSLEPTEETRRRGSILRPPNGQTHQWSPRRQKLFPVIWVLLGALTVPGRRVSIQRENGQARTHMPTGGRDSGPACCWPCMEAAFRGRFVNGASQSPPVLSIAPLGPKTDTLHPRHRLFLSCERAWVFLL